MSGYDSTKNKAVEGFEGNTICFLADGPIVTKCCLIETDFKHDLNECTLHGASYEQGQRANVKMTQKLLLLNE